MGIYVGLAFIAVMGLVNYGFQGTFRSASAVYFAIIVGAAVWGVSTWVVTDREQISAACDQIAGAANTGGDMDVMERLLDEEFTAPAQSRTRNRKDIVKWLKKQIHEYDVKKVNYKILELNLLRDHADMLIQTDVTCIITPLVRMHWEVEWIKQPDGWKVLKIADGSARKDTAQTR